MNRAQQREHQCCQFEQPPRVGERLVCTRINWWIHRTNYCTLTKTLWIRASMPKDFFSGRLTWRTWICIFDTCIIIFLVQYSWFQLFCYGYFVIGYLWKFLKLTWKRCSDSSHVRLQQQTFNKILLDFDLITRDWKLTSHHVLSTPFLHQDYENQRYLKIFRSHLNQCSYAR